MTQVFISYSRKDISFIKQLVDDLKIAKLDAWYDLSGLEGGTRWSREIEKAIKASRYVIVVLSPDSVASMWVEEEILYARKLGRKIIPLLYIHCDLPFGLHTLNYIDVQGSNYRLSFKEILRALDIEHNDRELAEKTILEKVENILKAHLIAEEHARIEKEEKERKDAEIVAQEKAKRDSIAKVKRERAERQAAQIVALKETLSNFFTSIKSALSNAVFLLRISGFVGIAIAFFWIGTLGFPKLVLLIPTQKASLISTLRPSSTFTITISPQTPTKTITPKPTLTKTQTPAITVNLPTEITDAKGVNMMLVPEGEFMMGSIDGNSDESPIHAVYLDAFYIDKYEADIRLYKECVYQNVCNLPKEYLEFYNNNSGDSPIVNITWYDAVTFCEWRNTRLPSEAEWEKSAKGVDQRIYPWGNDFVEVDGSVGNYYEYARFRGNAGFVRVDSYDKGVSPFGIYNLAGNVWEWVADRYDKNYYSSSEYKDPQGPKSGGLRVLRGGSFRDQEFSIRTTYRYKLEPSTQNYSVGFRCAKDAMP